MIIFLIRLTGLGFLFCFCVALGNRKACKIKFQTEQIRELITSMHRLAEYVRTNGGELELLIKKCFPSQIIYIKEHKLCCKDNMIDNSVKDILKEFISSLGSNDKKTEYDRIIFYSKLFEDEYNRLKPRAKELSRLYNTLGALCGAAVSLIFL